jgi:ABC-type multidrug transport system ATPase subunit
MLEMNGVAVFRRGAFNPCLNSLSLRFEKGQAIALCGSNGSGKTTLLETLVGNELLLYDDSRVLFEGVSLLRASNSKAGNSKLSVCYLSQMQKFIAHDKVSRFLDLASASRGSSPSAKLIHQFGIEQLLKNSIGSLSQGQWKRVQCVAHFSQGCNLRLLDEPEAALDSKGTWELVRCIQECKEQGEIVIVASHNTMFLKNVCDHVVVLEKGRVVWSSGLKDYLKYCYGSF